MESGILGFGFRNSADNTGIKDKRNLHQPASKPLLLIKVIPAGLSDHDMIGCFSKIA